MPTIRLFKNDGVVEVCGNGADVLDVVTLMWWLTPRITVVKGEDGETAANWAMREEEGE